MTLYRKHIAKLPAQPRDAIEARPRFRRGASALGQLVVFISLLAVLALLSALVLSVISSRPSFSRHTGLLMAFGVLGIWRWGWAGLHVLRAAFYRYGFYPILRWRAARAVAREGPITEVYAIATTYKEDEWITETVFESLLRELGSLCGLRRPAAVIAVTGCDADDHQVHQAYEQFLASEAFARMGSPKVELVLLRGDNGKRLAIAQGLKRLAEFQPADDAVVLLMDGDTMIQPGGLARVLPFFRLKRRIAAVTTNEEAYIEGPTWFCEWISLRFGQRHLHMCSLALSKMLLCLTGRLSVFRADVATDPSFIQNIEDDRIQHWLFGEFQMMSGDDKSSWFWIASRGGRMLYVPDAMATTFEIVENDPLSRAVANMNRWSGNMLRNSWRAIRVGPGRLGLFPWLCVVDQRISMWTVLIGPIAALLAGLTGRLDFVVAYLLWVLCSRILRVMPASLHGRRLSAWYVPMQLFSEWVGAFIKLWVLFHPVKQLWLNRGRRSMDSSRSKSFRLVRHSLATYLYAFSTITFVFVIGMFTRVIPIWNELPLVTRSMFSDASGRTSEAFPIELRAKRPVFPSTFPTANPFPKDVFPKTLAQRSELQVSTTINEP